MLAAAWNRVRRGLFWVQFAMFWLALVGMVGFGKTLYLKYVGPLPKGDGAEWISIEGFINAQDQNAIPVSKEQILNLGCYGLPVFFACILLAFGRLVSSGGPRASGSRTLFALSSLLTLLAFAALFASYLFAEPFPAYARIGFISFLLMAPLAEFWFLTALTACGLSLKRPSTVRTVGLLGFLGTLAAAAATLGWEFYAQDYRPKKVAPTDDVALYEQAALMLSWLLFVAVYWRAARTVRVGAREFIDTVAEKE